jgi:Mg2+-importing ATPase
MVVTVMSVVIMVVGVSIPFSPWGAYLGFTKLPSLYWPFLGLMLASYMLLTQGVKMFILWRKGV